MLLLLHNYFSGDGAFEGKDKTEEPARNN